MCEDDVNDRDLDPVESGESREMRERVGRLLADLQPPFANRISTGEAVRRQHANTLTWIAAELPDAVVWPLSTEEVAEIVRLAGRHRVPIVAFGSGTSLEGHVNAPHGGISLDLSRMNRIVEVSPGDLDCTLEAGVTRGQLNRHLRDTGLFFPVDPGSAEATLGGMAATRASGTTSVRYGTMRDNVVRLTAVMADGTIVRTGRRVRKSAAGYDLTRLLVGSEGTLGIITELTVRLHPVPECVRSVRAAFPCVHSASSAAIEAIQHGLAVARIELMDAAQIRAVKAFSGLEILEAPTLLVDFHGTSAGVPADVEGFVDLVRGHGATDIKIAADEAERTRLWRARHDAFWAIKAVWPGRATMVTDVCVPVSRLAECVAQTAEDIAAHGLVAPLVGHVGDGNFHAIVVFDQHDAVQSAAVRAFCERLWMRALSMDGTCTGEHGIGQGKIDALAQETGRALEVMRRVKQALDPSGLLNPGKLFRTDGA